MYDYIIVTHLPSFYKVNLYNELAKRMKIYVVFLSYDTKEHRSDDFVSLDNAFFDYEVLSYKSLQNRNIYKNIFRLSRLCQKINYKKIIISGWDLIEYWFLLIINSKNKNCLVLESTIFESNTKGIKGLIKKLFLAKISTVFASGELHVKLLEALHFNGDIKITKGVGIINKPKYKYLSRQYNKNFLYIGRLTKVKNLELLIEVFNEMKDYKLTIIGTGEDEGYLKHLAKPNIIFKGSINNSDIKNFFLANDILILPSISETWGLVVEEALYFGLPVIVSKNCGSSELIIDGLNGYVVDPYDKISFKNIISSIDNTIYKRLVQGVRNFSLNEKDKVQIKSYEL